MQIKGPQARLSALDVKLACEEYVQNHGKNPELFTFDATIFWRAKYVTVDIEKKRQSTLPVLTDAVSER